MLPLILGAAALGALILIALDREELQEHRLAVIGPRQTGKTTLSRLLAENALPGSVPQTTVPESFKGAYDFPGQGWVRWQDIASGTGSRFGNPFAWGQWWDMLQGADRILYVYRVDLLIRNDRATLDCIARDAEHLGAFLRQHGTVPVILVGNFSDQLWASPGQADGDLLQAVRAHPTIQKALVELGGVIDKNRLVVGNLAEPESARALADEVVKEVLRDAS